MKPYQFALLRYMHSASAGELVNIGLLMWLPNERQLLHSLTERYSRLSTFFPGFDGPGYRQMVRQLVARIEDASEELHQEGKQPGLFTSPPQSLLDILPFLLREDSSCLQWSGVMAGVASEPNERLGQLAAEFIERHESRGPRQRRDEAEIWGSVERRLRDRKLLDRVESSVEITGDHYKYRFKTGWHNGKRQVLEPISFDYLNATDLVDKANTWSGRLLNLEKKDFEMTGVVAPPERRDLTNAFEDAMAILGRAPKVRRLITEDQLDGFMTEIEHDLTTSGKGK